MPFMDSKFKEKKPLDTVHTIRGILHDAGIFTVETWNDSMVANCYSVRIEIAGTPIGQNGKGVTREFALASGYAELMERIQTGYFYVGEFDGALAASGGFLYAPDEKVFAPGELESESFSWLDALTNAFAQNSCRPVDRRELIDCCRYAKTAGPDGTVTALPFFNITRGQTEYVPVPILRDIYATNGTCAGNLPREALVQGLSEIWERHNNLRILREGIIPPTVPDSYLQQFESAYRIIENIRSDPRYALIVKDCSLGSGFPVIASAFINREAHTYIVKFGAHPVFEIALERSLTEMFQGRSLENASSSGALLANDGRAARIDNLHNALKNASGNYPCGFFSDRGGAFTPFKDRRDSTNEQLLCYMIALTEGEGCDILIRDCSYLGFPSFQILAPGFSELYAYGLIRFREKASHAAAFNTLRRFWQASLQELRALERYLRYKESFSMENTLSFTCKLPFITTAADDRAGFFRLRLLVALRLGRWDLAARDIQLLNIFEPQSSRKKQYEHARAIIELRNQGMSERDIADTLPLFYPQETGLNILQELQADLGFLCGGWNCENCKASVNCAYPTVKKTLARLKEIYGRTPIPQNGSAVFE